MKPQYPMQHRQRQTRPSPSEVVLIALGQIAADEERLQAFLGVTGLDPAEIGRRIEDPAFLAGVADYVLRDEDLLLAVCHEAGFDPAAAASALMTFNEAPFED